MTKIMKQTTSNHICTLKFSSCASHMKQPPDAYIAIGQIKKIPIKKKSNLENNAPILRNHEFFKILIEDIVKKVVPK